MEKNSKSSKSPGVCKRIFRAIKGQNKHPEPVELRLGNRNGTRKTDLASVMKADKTNSNLSATKPASKVVVVAPKPNNTGEGGDSNMGTKHGINDDKFSDFINRAKMKIRTVSNVGGGAGKRPARTDSINDKALDYINRAKMRIRTTSSSLGNGIKSLTFK